MSVPIDYATGWYSISPAFAWWNFDAHRMADDQSTQRSSENY